MQKIKLALLLASLVSAPFAFSQVYTVDEHSELQGKLERAKKLAELADQQKRINTAEGNTTAPIRPAVATTRSEPTIYFVGEYGIGKDLHGDFEFNGAPVTLSLRSQNDYQGWTVEALTPTSASIVQRGKNGKIVKRMSLPLVGSMKGNQPMNVSASGPTSGDAQKASITQVPSLRPAQ